MKNTLIILCGIPASGKSTFAQNYLAMKVIKIILEKYLTQHMNM